MHGPAAVRESLAMCITMKGTLDLKVTGVLEAGGLAFVAGVWTFTGTGPDGKPVTLTGRNGDVLRRQADGSWRFVIDNPWAPTEPGSHAVNAARAARMEPCLRR